MKPHQLCWVIGLAIISVPDALALTVSECRDAGGEKFFSETCPPGSERVGERRLPGKSQRSDAAGATQPPSPQPVVLYTTGNCDPCEVVRSALQRRGVAFAEKDVSSDPTLQAELKSLAGSITVPTIAIGKDVLTGYNQAALDLALARGGYAVPTATSAPAAEGEAPAAGQAAPPTGTGTALAAPPTGTDTGTAPAAPESTSGTP